MTDAADPIAGSLPLLLVLLAAGAYGAGVLRLARRGDRWPRGAAVWFAVGLLAVLVGTADVLPGRGHPSGGQSFPQQIVSHLVVIMLAPTALALGAPVTLWLRACRPGLRRRTLRLLSSRAARWATLPPVVVLLDVTGLSAYYLTPLFATVHQHPALHALVHTHMFVTGFLVSWFVLGRDPGPRRGGLVAQLSVLLATAVAHDVLAKLMYSRLLPAGAGTPDQIQAGAQLLYYGGDGLEVLTAAIVLTAWYRRGGRELDRQRRRNASRPHARAAGGN